LTVLFFFTDFLFDDKKNSQKWSVQEHFYVAGENGWLMALNLSRIQAPKVRQAKETVANPGPQSEDGLVFGVAHIFASYVLAILNIRKGHEY
jgi:hypothetical protein